MDKYNEHNIFFRYPVNWGDIFTLKMMYVHYIVYHYIKNKLVTDNLWG